MAFIHNRSPPVVLLMLVAISIVTASRTCVTHDSSFTPDAALVVSWKNISQSCYPVKETVVVNGTTPGPELRIMEGKTYWIRVYNNMANQNLTMHWHGLSQALSPFSDGTPLASQWPIPPLHFFDYEINVPVGMAGTYFYHSHVGFQAISAAGPLIVEEQDKTTIPYHYDKEKIVFLQDVFTKNDSAVVKGLLGTPLSWSGETAMVLMNGKGGGSANGTACNASLGIIDVEPGKTYRLRFIGGTALTFASLGIEDHNDLKVIEADGSYTKPLDITYLQIATGQRYSLLLTTKAHPEKETYTIQLESRERPTLTRGFAVLRYSTSKKPSSVEQKFYPPVTVPLTLPNTTLDFLDYSLSSLHYEHYPNPEEVTRRVTITVHQSVLSGGPTIWVQNSYPWQDTFPQEPYLVSLYKSDSAAFPSMERALQNNGIDPITRAFPAQIGEVLEVIVQNTGADSGGQDVHPFHQHGQHYWDLGSGNGTYDHIANDALWESKTKEGVYPPVRDTSMLYRYRSTANIGNGTAQGWRAWRYRVEQPGVWMVHCHILQHMVMGMQTLWVTGNSSEVLTLKGGEGDDTGVQGLEGYLMYGGSVMGNETHAPQVVHFKDNLGSDAWTDEQP